MDTHAKYEYLNYTGPDDTFWYRRQMSWAQVGVKCCWSTEGSTEYWSISQNQKIDNDRLIRATIDNF